MTLKILINTTSSDILLDIGITVPANSQIQLNPQDYDDASSSDDIVEFVGDGSLVINNGDRDLTKSEGIRLIQGGNTDKIQLDNDLLTTGNGTERIKIDVAGSLNTTDGRVLVSANDTDADFLSDKIEAGSNKVTITELNDGADESLSVDIEPQNINTADLNNDAQFITSGQAPVQPSDIADFETSSELDARDTANRDRANHTGTQIASTISDFNVAVQNAETLTNLSFNSSTNILTYTNEAGQDQTVDLTQYLDDTNLARIVNGTLDGNTGIITFIRDDSTTFTIDASDLLDNQDASEVPVAPSGNLTATDVQQALEDQQNQIDVNAAKVSADGSIDTHSDVDISTNPPAINDVLKWDGSQFVPNATSVNDGFTIFPIWAEENGGLSNNNRQWSFGNGSTGSCDVVIPIDCEIFAFSVSAESATGMCSFDIYKNGSQFQTTNMLLNHSFQTFSTPLQWNAGQRLGYRTNNEAGSFTDVRICTWFRIKSSPASSSVLNDLLDVTLTSVQNGQALVFNGSSWVNQDIFDGDYNNLINRPTLGTAADNDETDFATAAQGALANSALQPGDDITELNNNAGFVDSTGAAAAAPVQSVNGETGLVEDVAKTDESNTFTESQTINTTNTNANLEIKSDNEQANIILRSNTPTNGWQISAAKFGSIFNIDQIDDSGNTTEALSIRGGADEVDFYTKQLKNIEDPEDPQDAVTKNYSDNQSVNDRNRTNHTGTQLSSTISDFNSAVQNAQTLTSLTLSGNNLNFVDEVGNTTTIDLSLYLDDTNLARIVSGILDGSTGIATFTRDDNTTFTLDLSNLIDIVSIQQELFVALNGSDIADLDRGSLSRPFRTVKAAIDFAATQNPSASNPYCINVGPGIFDEDPISAPEFVIISGCGPRTRINANNPNADLLTLAPNSSLRSVSFQGVSGATNWHVVFNGNNGGAFSGNDVFISGGSNGLKIQNNSGLAVSTLASFLSVGVSGNVLSSESNSRLTIQGASITGNGITTNALRQNGTGIIIANAVSISTCLEGLVCLGNGVVDLNSVTINENVALPIDQRNSCVIRVNGGSLDFSKCTFSNIEVVNGYFESIEPNENKLQSISELSVGVPENGKESAFGEGDSYTRGMLVFNDDRGTIVEVTDQVKVKGDGQFTNINAASTSTDWDGDPGFEEILYISSDLEDSTGDKVKFFGFKATLTLAASNDGEAVTEYWNGSQWVEFNTISTRATGQYLPFGKKIFQRTGDEHIRFDPSIENSWVKNDPISSGTDRYWIRIYAVPGQGFSVAPNIDQIKLHSNRSEINDDGYVEYFGKARPVNILPFDIGSFQAANNSPQNQDLYIGDSMAVGRIENQFDNGTIDRSGLVRPFPLDIDTSAPVKLTLFLHSENTDTTPDSSWTIRWAHTSDGDFVGDSSADAPTIAATQQSITDIIPVPGPNEQFSKTFDLDVSDVISRRASQPGDLFWLTIQRNNDGNSSDLSLIQIKVEYVTLNEGGHL